MPPGVVGCSSPGRRRHEHNFDADGFQSSLGSLTYRGSRNQDITSDCMATWFLGSQRKQRSRKKQCLFKKNPSVQRGSRLGEMYQGRSPTWGVKTEESWGGERALGSHSQLQAEGRENNMISTFLSFSWLRWQKQAICFWCRKATGNEGRSICSEKLRFKNARHTQSEGGTLRRAGHWLGKQGELDGCPLRKPQVAPNPSSGAMWSHGGPTGFSARWLLVVIPGSGVQLRDAFCQERSATPPPTSVANDPHSHWPVLSIFRTSYSAHPYTFSSLLCPRGDSNYFWQNIGWDSVSNDPQWRGHSKAPRFEGPACA